MSNYYRRKNHVTSRVEALLFICHISAAMSLFLSLGQVIVKHFQYTRSEFTSYYPFSYATEKNQKGSYLRNLE